MQFLLRTGFAWLHFQTPQSSSKRFCCASYLELSSWCLHGTVVKHDLLIVKFEFLVNSHPVEFPSWNFNFVRRHLTRKWLENPFSSPEKARQNLYTYPNVYWSSSEIDSLKESNFSLTFFLWFPICSSVPLRFSSVEQTSAALVSNLYEICFRVHFNHIIFSFPLFSHSFALKLHLDYNQSLLK